VFGYSVAVLISLAYINMGCALDLQVLKDVIRRPIGPAIGFVSQVSNQRHRYFAAKI
jgi:sodium/bile acid cotransporter 3/5